MEVTLNLIMMINTYCHFFEALYNSLLNWIVNRFILDLSIIACMQLVYISQHQLLLTVARIKPSIARLIGVALDYFATQASLNSDDFLLYITLFNLPCNKKARRF